eukprot:Skav214233  [mRNA]  locus=scaffold1133:89151:90074:+ [translate_table: standard]
MASFQCMNPLFRSQWYTGDLDVAQLEPEPRLHDSLQKCSFWNGNATCCTPNLEALQQRALDTHKEKFQLKVGLLKQYSLELIQLSKDDAFELADTLDKKLLLRAIESIGSALKLAEPCMKRLVTYVAGMICFACQPDWSAYVWRNGLGEVLGVNVSPKACISVDWDCGSFGRTVQGAYLHIMESSLAKRLHTAVLPDFSMFFSRVELCSWLRTLVAMHPIPSRSAIARRLEASITPNDMLNETNVSEQSYPTSSLLVPTTTVRMPDSIPSAALPTVMPKPQAPPDATTPALSLDPSKDGLKTGFTLS